MLMTPAPADHPRRGEVWWVGFGPSVGGEIQKRRPAIVISNDQANRHLNRLQVVPITSSIGRLFPSEAYVTLNGEQRKAMADQLATISKARLGAKLGQLDAAEMQGVERAVRLQLGLAS
jgi:mRNA interferase MazF